MNTRISIIIAVLALVVGTAQAVTYTWNGSADGNWSNTVNWVGTNMPVDNLTDDTNSTDTFGLSMPYTDSIIFDGTNLPSSNFPGIGGCYVSALPKDSPTMIFNSGGSATFNVVSRDRGIWNNTDNKVNSVLTVGNGVSGGSEDVNVTITGLTGNLSRHDNGTRDFKVYSDGTLTFDGNVDLANSTARKATFTVAGGDVIINGTVNDLDFTGCSVNFLTLSGSFTADYGQDYVDFAAVTNSIGVDFLQQTTSGELRAIDNGSSFTVTNAYVGGPVETSLNFLNLSTGDGTTNSLTLRGDSRIITVLRTADGNNYRYSVTYGGEDFGGDAVDDTLTFDVLVQAWSGGTADTGYTNSTSPTITTNSTATIGTTDQPVTLGVSGFAVNGATMNVGESLEFSLENINVALSDSGYNVSAVPSGFISLRLAEYNGGFGHNTVVGSGTGLRGIRWNDPNNFGGFDTDTDPLYVTAAINQVNGAAQNRWQATEIDFGIVITVSPPSATVIMFE